MFPLHNQLCGQVRLLVTTAFCGGLCCSLTCPCHKATPMLLFLFRKYCAFVFFQRCEEDEAKRLLQLSKEALSQGAGEGVLDQLDHNEEELILAEYESDDEKKVVSG